MILGETKMTEFGETVLFKKVKSGVEARLTAKQERFCQEYPKDFNATRAALAAKYSKKQHIIQARKT
jgi:hypothetical protein